MSAGELFVKVCGITRLEDAELAADLGASAVGFIFWPRSARYIAPERARDIIRRKPAGVKAVGVFVDDAADHVQSIARTVGLDMVQLHGNESSALVCDCQSQLQSRGRVIKAIGLRNGAPIDVSGLDEDVLILLDAYDPERHGGTGRTVDWETARGIAASRPTILSGGLTPDNVRAAIAAVRPYGVDVSSGVESAPGLKDAALLRRFFGALHD